MPTYILTLLAFVFTLFAMPSHAAISNANNPNMACVPMGSLSADGVVFMGASHKGMVIDAVYLLNEAAIAASNTDYVQIELKKGSTIVAEIDSRAAHENGIAANTVEALNIVSAEKTVSAQDVLTVNYNETDSGTAVALTDAMLCMNYTVK